MAANVEKTAEPKQDPAERRTGAQGEEHEIAESGGPGEGDSSANKGGGVAHGQPAKES